MACWTTLIRSIASPAWQGCFSLKQWMCLSSDPQLLDEFIITVLSKPSHAGHLLEWEGGGGGGAYWNGGAH